MHELTETSISCPYCGEAIDVLIEALEHEQEYIEDCQVCCSPIVFTVSSGDDGNPQVWVRAENE
jgi:hypothetical protein